ncbi:hypothetical protein LEMLEM_LOCUS11710 [Lemmus lemmus]
MVVLMFKTEPPPCLNSLETPSSTQLEACSLGNSKGSRMDNEN